MIKVIYNGTDITGAVSVNRCIHDMYARGRADTLHLRVNDVSRLWDTWAPARGDELRVDYGTISTGTMFLADSKPRNGTFELFAQSAPLSGYAPQRKAWRQVRLLQIAEEIARRNGLEFTSYGVTDRLYAYVQQEVSDFAFLYKRAQLEGCAFIIYDKRLILYSEQYMEGLEPAETLTLGIGDSFEYSPMSAEPFSSCVVSCGQYSGSFTLSGGSGRVLRPEVLGGVNSNAEAERFAKGLLRAENKACRRGFAHTPVLKGYAPGSVLTLENPCAPSMDGPIFLDHVRNEYTRNKAKLFFHKPLEGY